jgi:BirA family transcriptional regulator, biotin operon repressor / biotin---[acetyl-CoA-carboxylase] ligase
MIDGEAPVETFEEIDSTVLEARRRADRGEVGPVWLIARRQTAGRGRRGRTWITIDGNLFATLLFTTSRPPQEIALLSFATGLAIAETFEAFCSRAPSTLKWPNDVLIGGAKASGILLDSGSLPGGAGTWAALAFGVNLAGAPQAIDQPTISLSDALAPDTRTPEPLEFFAALRPRLEAWANQLVAEGFEPLRQAWLARAHGLGQDARVMQGADPIIGQFAGLSPRGELELETPAGRRLISAGDVYFSNAA